MPFKTLLDLFDLNAAKYARTSFVIERLDDLKEKTVNLKFSFAETKTQSKKLRDILASLGHGKADKIAIWSQNSYQWIVADFAIMSLGAVTVGIHPELPDDELSTVLKTLLVKTIFVNNIESLKRLKQIQELHKLYLKNIIITDPKITTAPADIKGIKVHVWDALMGENINTANLKLEKPNIGPDDIASIALTDGTSGAPKLVELSHKKLLSVTENISKSIDLKPGDVFLPVGSLSIITERVLGIYHACLKGFSIAIPSSDPANYFSELESMNVTACSLSPKMLNQVQQKIFMHLSTRPILSLLLKIPLLDLFAQAEIKKILTPQLKFFICYGDTISPRLELYLRTLNFKLIPCFSLAEAAGVLSIGSTSRLISGSSGKILKNIEVKRSASGELLCTGTSISTSYLIKSDNSENFIHEDLETWLKTGDIGSTRNQHLFISGKQKDRIISASGKTILVNSIEALLESIPYIENAVLVGQNKEFISALLAINEEFFYTIYKKTDKYSITRQCEIDIQNINQNLNEFEKIKKFSILDNPLSISRGELTPTLKTRRFVIEELYREKIDDIYN